MIQLYNSIAQEKQQFIPYDQDDVRMYVCGPTVYNRPHIGNARSIVVYDVLFRLLNYIYGQDNVNYVRNITDVDDKINAQALANDEPIEELTERITGYFHADMAALNNLAPTIEPKATQHIDDIIVLIERLVAENCAYVADNHVLFDVQNSHSNIITEHNNSNHEGYFYGKLSGKKLDDLIAGARIDVADYKKNAGDFVLWKPSEERKTGWNSPFGYGRPGWHIECSAMSVKYLGQDFDIHGGGADLKFPHHENEIIQSICAHKNSNYAKYWVHNGFLTVGGEKMSKSLGNFTTVNDLLQKNIHGEVIRYALMSTHYRKPLDFTDKLIEDSKKAVDNFYRKYGGVEASAELSQEFIESLEDDVNTPKALAYLHSEGNASQKTSALKFLGFLQDKDYKNHYSSEITNTERQYIEDLIEKRNQAKKDKNWLEADKIRDKLSTENIVITDTAQGTEWHKK